MPLKKVKNDNLKIGFVFDDSLDRVDGVAQYVKTLGKWLTKQGYEVGYLVGETKMKSWAGGKIYSLAENIHVSFNGNRLTTPRPADKKRIDELLSNEAFDVLHIQMPYSPFMAKHAINLAPKLTAVVGTFHILPAGWMARWGTSLLRFTYGKSLKRIDKYFSVSENAAIFAEITFKIKSKVLPNVIEADLFVRPVPAKRTGHTIVFLGRLVERKGAMFLLKAFSNLAQQLPDAKLIVAGDGPERNRLEDYVRKSKLEQSIIFKGFIDEKEKASLLNSADIACFPALYGESFGIVLIEAMAAGAGVVIGGDNLGYRSVLDSDMLINPRDTTSFANCLRQVLSNPELATNLHERQQAKVKQYDVEVVGPKLVQEYRDAVAKRRKSSDN